MSETKWCPKGRHTVPRSGFHRSRREKDGLKTWCKECAKSYLNDFRKTETRTCKYCSNPLRARGMCATHYNRWHKTGDARPDTPVKRKDGTGWYGAGNYFFLYKPEHPNANGLGVVSE